MSSFSQQISILVIEDNLGDFILIEEYLNAQISNPKITHTKTFHESTLILTNELLFDVIFLDLSLPDASGKELVDEIVSVAGNTPIIALTGYQDKGFSVKMLSLGVSDYLLKDELNPSLLYKSIIYNIERKRINIELKESEKKYRNLFQLSPIPMLVIDPETLRFLNVNYAAIQNYGYTNEEFLSITLKDIKPTSELEKLEILKKDGLPSRITKHLKKNGELIHVEIQSSVIDFNQKKAWLQLATNITEKLKAQEALINSEHYFKVLVQDSADLITILDSDGNYKYMSPSSKTFFGMNPIKLIGKNVFDYIHNEDRERVLKQFLTLKEKKRVQVSPFRFKGHKNSWIWLEINATNMLNDIAVNGIVVNARDITLNVNYNLKLKETVERYEALSKATSDAIWDHDFDIGRTYIAGEGYKNLFGYNIVNQFTENLFWESHIHPDDRETVVHALDQALKNSNITQSQFEYRFLKADGNYAYVLDKFFIIRENGKALRILGAKQDITRQKIEEYRLKLLESVITNSTDAVMITEAFPIKEPGPKIVFVNEATVKMTGYEKEELIGKSPRMLQGVKTNRQELDRIRKAVESQTSCDVEIINYNKKGEEYWVEMAIAPITDHTGKISHLIAIERDITNRKQLEQEKEKLITELIQHNKDLRQFSYITSHNLRGPIANLLGLSSLIDNFQVKNPTLKEILDGIKKAAHMFDDTIKDLTKVLNIKDQTSIPKEELLIETYLEKAISQNKILIDEIGAMINFDFTKAPTIKFNKAYIESILFNLLSNAIKYKSPKRPLVITVTSENVNEAVILKFKDNGLGIDTSLYGDRLFRLYQRFHDHVEGKGLGLFLIKSQLEAFNGTIEIESQINNGTTFILKFSANKKQIF